MIALGENLKRLRLAGGMTQEELADVFGVAFQTVSKWERGESCPDVTLLPGISSYFGVTVDDLLADRDRQHAHTAALMRRYDAAALADRPALLDAFREKARVRPGDHALLVRYMELLQQTRDHVRDPGYAQTARELTRLYERIERDCADDAVRVRAKRVYITHLMRRYDCLGFDENIREQARAVAASLPRLRDSREYVSVLLADASTHETVHQQTAEELLFLLQNTIAGLCYDSPSYSEDEKIAVMEDLNGLIGLLCPIGKNAVHRVYNERRLTCLYAKRGARGEAVSHLILACELARAFDETPDGGRFLAEFEQEDRYAGMGMRERVRALFAQNGALPAAFRADPEVRAIMARLDRE